MHERADFLVVSCCSLNVQHPTQARAFQHIVPVRSGVWEVMELSEVGGFTGEVGNWGWALGFTAWPDFLLFLSASCVWVKCDLPASRCCYHCAFPAMVDCNLARIISQNNKPVLPKVAVCNDVLLQASH